MFDLQGFGALLLSGATVTIKLALTSLVIGMALGLLGATAKMSNVWLLRKLATVYTATMRGIPELLLVLFIYYGGSILLMSILKKFGYNDYIEISAFWGGVMALSIAFGAYATEIFRMSIQEIPVGQREAAQAIGMRPFQTFYRITLPPVWQAGQYCIDESEKLTSAMVAPQTGQGWPVRPCTCRLERLSSLSSLAASPWARSTAADRVSRSAA